MNKKRLIISGISATAAIISLAGILLILNLFASKIFLRWDATQNKIFTISEASKNIASKLDDRLNVKIYVSSNLPAELKNIFTEVKDKIEEYKAYSNGNLDLEVVEIGEDDDVKKDAEGKGIYPLPIDVREADARTQKIVYLGMTLRFGDKEEVIPVIVSTQNLEYEISRAIKKLTSNEEDQKDIAFSEGQGEPGLFDKLGIISNVLKEEFSFPRTFDFNNNQKTEIPEDIGTLIIASPRESFSEYKKYLIDQFLMNGGSILFLLDSVDVDINEGTSEIVEHNLYDLLENYGVKIHKNLLLDESSIPVNTMRQVGNMQISERKFYPLLPLIKDFNPKNIITQNLEQLVFPFLSQIELIEKDSLNSEELIKTSKKSWTMEGPDFNIFPGENPNFEVKSDGPFDIAVSEEGEFKSFFKDKEIPKNESEKTASNNNEDSPEESGEDLPQPDPEKKLDKSKEGARIIVISDGGFIKDEYIGSGMNLDTEKIALFMNTVDWLTQDIELISIRAREKTLRPLEFQDLSISERKFIKFLNWFGISIVIGILGLVKWQLRTRKKNFEFKT